MPQLPSRYRYPGQHPGGIVVVPGYKDIWDFTPFQYPADDPNSAWRTTHFDYHAIDQDVLKLDILGHTDPTQLRMIQDITGDDITKVPHTVLTVGIGTIMSAKEVLILVNGHNKARALAAAVEGSVNHMWTISALQMHPKGIIVCDEAATLELKVGTYKYFLDIEKDNLK